MKDIFFKLAVIAIILSLAFSICPKMEVAKAETESAINVYSTNSGLIAPAPVIMEYNGDEDISAFTKTVSSKMVRPSTMIVEVDEDFTVLSGGERVAFDEFRLTYIKSKMLPTVRVESDGAANALISYLNTRGYDFIDFSVVSTNPSLVKKVRDDRVSIRGIIDYTKTDVSNMSAGAIANQMNANRSIIGIFGENQLDAERIFGIQARFKSVWINKNVENAHDAYEFIASGATGIITDNFATVYDAYNSIQDSTLSRGFYGIGHRGLSLSAGENTLEGMIEAYEAGATHVEVDTKVCKSGEIVIMHDDGLATTTNGVGTISEMTLSEIRKYKVVKNSSGESVTPCEIPTLEDIFKYFKGKDIVLVVETKNANANYPSLLAKLVDKYDIADQVVVIGFGTTELGYVRDQAPEIPTANLNGTSKSDFLIYMAKINALNTAMNASKSGIMTDSWMFKNAIARGYLPYCWTFTTTTETENAIARGVMGITSDRVDALGKYAQKVNDTMITVTQSQFENGFNLSVTTYKGDTETRTAKIFSSEKTGDNTYEAIISYNDNTYNRLVGNITVTVTADEELEESEPSESKPQESKPSESKPQESDGASTSENGKKSGCKGNLGSSATLFLLVVVGLASVISKVKKC